MGFGWDLQRTCYGLATKDQRRQNNLQAALLTFTERKKIIFSYKGKRNFKIVVTAFCK